MGDLLNFFKQRHYDHDMLDDFTNRIITGVALLVGVVLFASEYCYGLIYCPPNANFKNSWGSYVIKYCYSQGSYVFDLNDELPDYSQLDNFKKVKNYEWSPFIFLLIALMFYYPRVYWNAITSHLYFKDVCESSMISSDRRHNFFVERFLDVAKAYQMSPDFGIGFINRFFACISKRWLILNYYFIKIWMICNIIIAHLLVCRLTENEDDVLGLITFKNILNGIDWKISGSFPRETSCLIEVRQHMEGRSDEIKRDQILCRFPANKYIEKLFLITCLVFAILFVANVINLFRWILKTWYSQSYVIEKIRSHLQPQNGRCEERICQYATSLMPDSRFTFLMIEEQKHQVDCAKILSDDFLKFLEHKEN